MMQRLNDGWNDFRIGVHHRSLLAIKPMDLFDESVGVMLVSIVFFTAISYPLLPLVLCFRIITPPMFNNLTKIDFV